MIRLPPNSTLTDTLFPSSTRFRSPDGLLAILGLSSPLPISRTQWSWFANICNYGIVGGFFIAEYQYRKRHFPGRYDSLLHFLRKMSALGPAVWRAFLRPRGRGNRVWSLGTLYWRRSPSAFSLHQSQNHLLCPLVFHSSHPPPN